jgi:hypothetical protein
MAVRRIVGNIATDRLDAARAFWGTCSDVHRDGPRVNHDVCADGSMTPQISVRLRPAGNPARHENLRRDHRQTAIEAPLSLRWSLSE